LIFGWSANDIDGDGVSRENVMRARGNILAYSVPCRVGGWRK